MASNHYRFLTRWKIEGDVEEVFRVLDEVHEYVRWWPSVWLRVEVLAHGDADGIGGRGRFTTKGWLPYVLTWEGTTLEKVFPHRRVFRAAGEFEGQGVWTFRQNGAFVETEYHWDVVADKALLKYLSFLFRPLFAVNHNWAMARGRESLLLELARRQARTPEELARIPAPPAPTFLSVRRRERLGLGGSKKPPDPGDRFDPPPPA